MWFKVSRRCAYYAETTKLWNPKLVMLKLRTCRNCNLYGGMRSMSITTGVETEEPHPHTYKLQIYYSQRHLYLSFLLYNSSHFLSLLLSSLNLIQTKTPRRELLLLRGGNYICSTGRVNKMLLFSQTVA